MSGKKWPRLPVLQDLPVVGSEQALPPPKQPTCCDLHGGAAARQDEWVGKGTSKYAIVLPNPDTSAKPILHGLRMSAAYVVYATRCGAGTVALEGKHFIACRGYLALPPEVDTLVVVGERAWYTITGRKTLPRSAGSVTMTCGGRTVRAILVDEDAGQNMFALKEARNRIQRHYPSPPHYKYQPLDEQTVRTAPSTIAFDFETYGKLWEEEFRAVSVSLAVKDPNDPDTVLAYTWEGQGPAWLPSVLADPTLVKVAHNAVYDTRVAYRVFGVQAENVEDTLVMRKLINPDGDGTLDALAEICGFASHKWVADLNLEAAILAAKTLHLKTLKGRTKSFETRMAKLPDYMQPFYAEEFARLFDNPIPKDDLNLSRVFAYMNPKVRDEYNALDSYTTLVAYERLTQTISSGPLGDFYENHVKPAAKAVFRMAMTGIQVDPQRIERTVLATSAEADQRLSAFEQAWGCNPNARNDILATAKKLKVVSKDEKSLDKATLKATDHPFAKDLLGYRKVKKRLDAAIGVYEACWSTDSKIRPSFNMAGTRTGRLSCSSPNLQNIPKPGEGDEWSEMIRASFCPGPGMTLVQIDYSQVELVVMASLAKDQKAMHAIKSGSFHMDTARMVVPLALKIPIEQVTDSHKKIGKACNFAWLYGASDKKIAEMLGVDDATAKKCRKRVFSYFGATGKFIERVHMKAAEQGFVRTIFRGEPARFRVLFDFGAKSRSVVGSAKRKSFNTIIQGSANDVCLQALVKLDQWFQQHPSMGRIVLSIHDALLFEVPTHLASYVTKVACDMMTQDVGFPVSVEAETGPDWSDQRKWDPSASTTH